MSSQPPLRLKRAVQKPGGVAAKGNIISVQPVGGQSRSIPDASTVTAPKRVDPLRNLGLAAGLGASRKSAPPNTVRFERAPTTTLHAAGLGRTRKAPSVVIAYGRAEAPDTMLQAFASAGAHEFRREGKSGRNVLRAVLGSLTRGDTLMVERLADIASPKDLPRIVAEIESAGVHIVALDGGADTRTPQGRGKLANQIITAKALFGLRL